MKKKKDIHFIRKSLIPDEIAFNCVVLQATCLSDSSSYYVFFINI